MDVLKSWEGFNVLLNILSGYFRDELPSQSLDSGFPLFYLKKKSRTLQDFPGGVGTLLTGAKHPAAFSTNHLSGIDKIKHN